MTFGIPKVEMPLKVDAQLPLFVQFFILLLFFFQCCVVGFIRFYCALKPSVALAVTVGTSVSHSVYNQKWCKIYAPKKATDRLKWELIWMSLNISTFCILFFFFVCNQKIVHFWIWWLFGSSPRNLISVWPDEYQWVEWIMIKYWIIK